MKRRPEYFIVWTYLSNGATSWHWQMAPQPKPPRPYESSLKNEAWCLVRRVKQAAKLSKSTIWTSFSKQNLVGNWNNRSEKPLENTKARLFMKSLIRELRAWINEIWSIWTVYIRIIWKCLIEMVNLEKYWI